MDANNVDIEKILDEQCDENDLQLRYELAGIDAAALAEEKVDGIVLAFMASALQTLRTAQHFSHEGTDEVICECISRLNTFFNTEC